MYSMTEHKLLIKPFPLFIFPVFDPTGADKGSLDKFLYQITDRVALCELLNGTCVAPWDCAVYVHSYDRYSFFACNATSICCFEQRHHRHFDDHHDDHGGYGKKPKKKKKDPVKKIIYSVSDRILLCELLNGTCVGPHECAIFVHSYNKKHIKFDCNLTAVCCYFTYGHGLGHGFGYGHGGAGISLHGVGYGGHGGGYNLHRGGGGYGHSQGGYDDHGGGHDDHGGGYDDHGGGYDDHGGHGGGYDDHGGGHDDHGGGYDDNGDGYDDHGGGYDDHEDGYDDHGGGYDDHNDHGGSYDNEHDTYEKKPRYKPRTKSKPKQERYGSQQRSYGRQQRSYGRQQRSYGTSNKKRANSRQQYGRQQQRSSNSRTRGNRRQGRSGYQSGYNRGYSKQGYASGNHYGTDHGLGYFPLLSNTNLSEACISSGGVCTEPGQCATSSRHNYKRVLCNLTAICCLPDPFPLHGRGNSGYDKHKSGGYGGHDVIYKSHDEHAGLGTFGAHGLDLLPLTNRSELCAAKNGTCLNPDICITNDHDDGKYGHQTSGHNKGLHKEFYCNLTTVCCFPQRFEVFSFKKVVYEPQKRYARRRRNGFRVRG